MLLSLFFAPLYLRSKVATLPDFLERRFNRGCRDVLSVVSLFSAIVIHMGVAIHTAAWVLRGILGCAPSATIMGVFWKRASGKSALITLFAGMLLGFIVFHLDWNNLYRGDFMLIAFLLLVACMLIMVATTWMFPEPLKAEARILVWENWREPLRGEAGGHGLGNYRVLPCLASSKFRAHAPLLN